MNGSQTHIITFVRTIQNKVEPLVGDMAASQRKRAASGKTAGQGAKYKRRAAGKGAGAQEALLRKRRASCWRLFWTTKAGRKRKLKTLRTFSRVKTLRTFSRVCM